MNSKFKIVFCTVPDPETAVSISRKLVEEKLAACCNIIPGIRSLYFWEGEICDDQELLIIIKTHEGAWSRLEQRIKELHPYQVPEIIAVQITNGSESYLNWVDQNVKKE